MVERTRELQSALGTEEKRVMDNEAETVILQRRAIRTTRDLAKGEIIQESDLTVLRPCPTDALPPYRMGDVIQKRATRDIPSGDVVRSTDVEEDYPIAPKVTDDRVYVLIPALNEAETIARVVEGVAPYGMPLVVSDGSEDETAKIARDAGAVVLELKRNRGYEGALDAGFAYAVNRVRISSLRSTPMSSLDRRS